MPGLLAWLTRTVAVWLVVPVVPVLTGSLEVTVASPQQATLGKSLFSGEEEGPTVAKVGPLTGPPTHPPSVTPSAGGNTWTAGSDRPWCD